MINIKKTLLTALLIPFFVFANCSYKNCVLLPPSKTCKLRKCSIFTDISFLYWQGKTNGLDYGIVNQSQDTNLDGEVVNVDFKWEPAFRLALGMYLPHDTWDISVTYTRFEEKSNHRTTKNLNDPLTLSGPGIIPVWVHPAAYANQLNDVRFFSAKAKWKLNYNVIDLELGKDFCASHILSLKPYIGIQNAIIHQNLFVVYRDANIININGDTFSPLSTSANLKNFSYGIGPLFGMKSHWHMGCSFSLFTNLSLALLHTCFDLQRVENSLSTEIIDGRLRNDRAELKECFYSYKPHALLSAGIKWDKCFGCNKRFEISASYEGNYWWKQNQMIRFVDATITAKTRNTIGDLYLQGLSLNFRLDF